MARFPGTSIPALGSAALILALTCGWASSIAAQSGAADGGAASDTVSDTASYTEADMPTGDATAGAGVFRKCKACHSVGPGAKDRLGPHLNDLFDRPAGAHDGFRYSTAMERMGAEGLVWTQDTLDAYLASPKALVPGTRMAFAGLKTPEDRADVLAYLRQYSNAPEDAPAARDDAPEVDLPRETLLLVGDAEYGEYLASDCLTCHQITGADQGIRSITGWAEKDFVIAMHAYKQKIRPHPVMQMMAGRLSDEEIAALAAYFAMLNE